ncbi:RidA family protein [Bacillus swezeyi]|uniref:Reactive intermediate/imine deaminase n=1 Tax=Bacillus swezeyi TaxID=1925020 RepID=A0A1R1RMT3_9BACI|nr:RidA family protein [Bacillus swezeyi]MEC1261295.1 RidA family protein [Bacillus swezeyi]MED2929234.1 RidA family protein [Bacillus swezeyi]MED2963739.1 RidA family protein [Bacillus swezeyi]MED3073555.1 RidA family protein [Bacillus swezeyi]MED3081815.1 RidA family protein [Bacillus swezeyi]
MKPVHTKYSTRDGGHYVPAMEHNGVLYISGQLSMNPETGKIPAGGIKEEAKQALVNMELVLKERGLAKEDVILCRLYTPDVKYWPDINEVYAHFFGNHKPARVVVPSNHLYAGCLVEVEAIAAIKEEAQ